MRKAESLDRIAASALSLFAKRGYDGASLRDIADHAGVRLGLIDRHFGSKSDLFHEIHTRVWRDLNRQREVLLEEARAASGGNGLPLDTVVAAFVRPVVALALRDEDGRSAIRLVREGRTRMVHHDIAQTHERNAVRSIWIGELQTARPALSPDEAVWGFSLMVNACYSHQLLDRWLDHLMPGGEPASVDDVTAIIVRFCSAGIAALAGGL